MRGGGWISIMVLVSLAEPADALERIRRASPTPDEEAQAASEIVMNDGSLQRGDIVVTNRGFFSFKGVGADGYTFEFSQIENPLVPRVRQSVPEVRAGGRLRPQ